MTRKALYEKTFNKKPKFPGRLRHRCRICGRARSVYRKFALCRICFRQHALLGNIPGVKKSSW